jgi:hypothetical protein
MMKTETPTFDSVRALLQELTEKQAETGRQMKETDRQMKETGRQMKETDRQMKETDRQMKETDRKIDRMQATMGAWSTNIGAFAEEYFFNSFENGKQNFFGERFDEIEKNVKGFKKGFKDEYDIVLINGHSLGIIEVKFKAHEKDIPDILKKAVTFRGNFPDYANHQIYLGLATLAFYPELENECISEGIAVIKQVGDSVVINDAHLKVF